MIGSQAFVTCKCLTRFSLMDTKPLLIRRCRSCSTCNERVSVSATPINSHINAVRLGCACAIAYHNVTFRTGLDVAHLNRLTAIPYFPFRASCAQRFINDKQIDHSFFSFCLSVIHSKACILIFNRKLKKKSKSIYLNT